MPTNFPFKLKWEQKEVEAGLILGLGNSVLSFDIHHLVFLNLFFLDVQKKSPTIQHGVLFGVCAMVPRDSWWGKKAPSTTNWLCWFKGFKFQEALLLNCWLEK